MAEYPTQNWFACGFPFCIRNLARMYIDTRVCLSKGGLQGLETETDMNSLFEKDAGMAWALIQPNLYLHLHLNVYLHPYLYPCPYFLVVCPPLRTPFQASGSDCGRSQCLPCRACTLFENLGPLLQRHPPNFRALS